MAASTSPGPSLSGTSTIAPTVQSIGVASSPGAGFQLPNYASFPPFYTLQPNLTTRARQLELWTSLLRAYCSHHHIFRLSLSSPPPDLFTNVSIHRTLKPADQRILLEHLALPANGSVVEFIPTASRSEQSAACYVWFKTPSEWADALYSWVDETGQKNSVLTVYELRESDAVQGREWTEMDEGMLRKVLGVLVKRGKAQIFGQAEGEGVKFF